MDFERTFDFKRALVSKRAQYNLLVRAHFTKTKKNEINAKRAKQTTK